MVKNDKIRKVDLDGLSQKELEDLSKRLGNKISDIISQASEEANQVAKIYGLEVILSWNIQMANKEND